MNRFTRHIALILFFVITISIVFDFVYTKVYETATMSRTKFQYLRSLKNAKIDYLFLGSSRVENTIIPKLIKDETGKSAVNLGFQASKLSDIYTVLQLTKEYNISVDKIFIQVDYIFNAEDGYSNVFQYELMPFVRENKTTKEYFKSHFKEKEELFYFPFYRYCIFDAKIGSREFSMNLINKRTKITESYGFVGLEGNSSEHTNSLPDYINQRNRYFDKIKVYAYKNKMDIVFFCAPFCKHTKNLNFVEKLKKKIPDLRDFSQAVKSDELFKNCSHLNKEGADFFTEIIIKKMLLNIPE
ncbi:hypothetical protein [Flavobacterium aestuarii]|uniref:hypothetical protein n=1 Tax=Flavobacterium aestuarii TaxID=3149227 RepID=UPI0032B5D7D7